MKRPASGIHERSLTQTAIAVIDFETTGMSAGVDRAVELSVVRIDPGEPPRVVFDTLIDPCRPMAATFVHGITSADVRHAPRFSEIADELRAVLSGCVIAGHNVYFDMKFLEYEMGRIRPFEPVPYVCTLGLRPLVGKKRLGLDQACAADGVPAQGTHASRDDALAAAMLWCCYLSDFQKLGIQSFGDLTQRGKSYRFFKSFGAQPWPDQPAPASSDHRPLCPRSRRERAVLPA